MSTPPSVLVLGGGLAGMGAAYALSAAGCRVRLVERSPELGGLAGTFERDGHFYPLAYHHILHRDRTLLWFLDRLGALGEVRWRRIRMLFRMGDAFLDLAHPRDFLRFPMSVADKARFVRLMLRCFGKDDWSDWHDRSAKELVDRWAGPGVRRALFEPLTRLKFDLPCDAVSGAWLGARLHFREGSAPLGYIPGDNWTRVLCTRLAHTLRERGVEVTTGRTVVGLTTSGPVVRQACLDDGTTLGADRVVSTLPTEVYRSLLPDDATSRFERIRYTAIVSAICVTRQRVDPDFYWLNLPSLDYHACGLFRLESLNPTIGAPGETALNFVTHVAHRDRPFFRRTEDELIAGYADDFRRLFGFDLAPDWTRVARLPMYSPVFDRGYRNPPVRSERYRNVVFAGNFRTFPSIASTGTALASGLDAAAELLEEAGLPGDARAEIARYRLASRPRG